MATEITNELRSPLWDRGKKLWNRLTWFHRPIFFVCLYGFWVAVLRLVSLSIITYFVISPTSRFQDISDVFGSNEVSLMGLAAFLFLWLLSSLNPLTSTTVKEIITRESIEKNFLPGFTQGAILAAGTILAFVLSGVYRYVGFFIRFEEAPLEIANVILRMTALGALAYCEEFIFRYKVAREMKGHLSSFAAANLIAFLYCMIKLLQFDIGMMHVVTLYLISVALFYRMQGEEFSKGAGFWAGILIIFHPLLSLPIFGNDFSGALLIKYQAAQARGGISNLSSLTRFLTGGAGGPISSFAFQLLLILDIGRSILRQKRQKKPPA